jgi:uncharacterized protein involved in exopolysaccharide biosynthesis
MPTELIIDKMRKNIIVDLEKTDNEKLAAFKISYRDRTPEAARNVTAEIASKYVNAQVIESTDRAKVTQEFIDKELLDRKTVLDGLEKQRLEIMMKNVETLPESAQGLIAQLEGLRKSEENYSKDIQSLNSEKGRLNDGIRALNSQIRLVEDLGEKDLKEVAIGGADVTKTPAYGQLIQKRAELTAKLKNLKSQYTDKMPIVVDIKEQIRTVEKELNELKENAERTVANISKSNSIKTEMQKRSFEIEKQKIEGQISNIDTQTALKNQQLQQNAIQISALEAKINTIPNVKVALEGVEQQYQSAKTAYDDLLKKKNNAQLQVNRESNAQGETIQVVDAANLPTTPVAPKRALLTALGSGVGFALGLFLAAMFEIPRLFRIQSVEDAKHYTGLPLLAAVPPLLTHNEIAWKKRSYWLKVMAGVAVAIGVIPLIIMALQATRVFERVVS